MDEATFNREVAFIRHAYCRPSMGLPKFVASSYEGIADEAEQLGLLDELIGGSEIRKEFWDTVNLIARRQLMGGNPLPAPLANWIKDVLSDQYAGRQKEKTRPRPDQGPRHGVRDQNIRRAIENLIARRFKATRSGGPRDACAEGGSACDVVGAAFGLAYKNTERIWLSKKA